MSSPAIAAASTPRESGDDMRFQLSQTMMRDSNLYHLPDLTAFVPVFEGDELRFWSINRAHQSDIGGATHGAYNASATDIWQEGIRITPLKLYDRGELRRDVMQMIATNVRHPRDFRGDLAAMIGSAP